MRWLIAVSLVIALVIVVLHAADVHRTEGLNLVGPDRGTDRAYTPQRMRVEVVDFCGRVAEVPIAVRGDNVAFGLGSVEVTIPPRSYNAFTFYLWRLDKQVAHATVSMTPDGGVFVRIDGRMGGEYELHGNVLIVRLYKDGLTCKHVLLIAPVVIVVVATIIGLVMMATGRYGGGADPRDAPRAPAVTSEHVYKSLGSLRKPSRRCLSPRASGGLLFLLEILTNMWRRSRRVQRL
jgi:hypothetical protein